MEAWLSYSTLLGYARLFRLGVACWVAWWVGGRVRKAENKAKAPHCWGLGLAELGKKTVSVLWATLRLLDPFREKWGHFKHIRYILQKKYLHQMSV